MKKHLSLAITVLLAAMLACDSVVDFFQQAGNERFSKVGIKNLAVNPPAGNGSGGIELAVTYEWYNDLDPYTGRWNISESIECNLVSPNFITKHIGTIPPSSSTETGTVTQTAKLSFVIDQPAQPGTYVVGCTPITGTKQVTTTFIVTEEKAPTESPVAPPAATQKPEAPPQEPPKPPSFLSAPLKGQIVFDYANAQSDRPSAGGEAYQVTDLCVTEITVGSDGSLSGQCEKSNAPGHLVANATITVQVTGTVDSTGNVTFSYDVSEIGAVAGAWRISYEGTGKFTSATQATGTANFSYSCQSGDDNRLWCYPSTTYESFSGTLPWSFVPSP